VVAPIVAAMVVPMPGGQADQSDADSTDHDSEQQSDQARGHGREPTGDRDPRR
jgi:hypothetical protein